MIGCEGLRFQSQSLTVLTTKDAVNLNVVKLVASFVIFPQTSFVCHADLLHNATRGSISGKMVGVNASQSKLLESIGKNLLGGLAEVAVGPIRFADPISQCIREIKWSQNKPFSL